MIGELKHWHCGGRTARELFEDYGETGDIVSSLFPYRVVHALRQFGVGALPALNSLLAIDNQILRIRAACSVVSIDQGSCSEYEAMMLASIREGGMIAREALCALRCFERIATAECIKGLINTSRSIDTDLSFLAVRALVGNCVEAPETIEAIQEWTCKADCGHSHAALPDQPWLKSIWKEIYYWSSGS